MISKKLFSLRRNLNLSKFLQMRLNSWLIRFLPFFMSRYYLIVLGKLYYYFNRKERDLINKTISFVLESSLKPRAITPSPASNLSRYLRPLSRKTLFSLYSLCAHKKVFYQKNAF